MCIYTYIIMIIIIEKYTCDEIELNYIELKGTEDVISWFSSTISGD